MSQDQVPIPGDILDQSVILGLSFEQVVTLGSVPLVITLPAVFLPWFSFTASLVVAAIASAGVLSVVLLTPEGHTPLEWFPAYVQRRLGPSKYLQISRRVPPGVKHDNMNHSRVMTADLVKCESENPEAVDGKKLVESINYAERLEHPEWVQQDLITTSGETKEGSEVETGDQNSGGAALDPTAYEDADQSRSSERGMT